jgi:hypothetical protein
MPPLYPPMRARHSLASISHCRRVSRLTWMPYSYAISSAASVGP